MVVQQPELPRVPTARSAEYACLVWLFNSPAMVVAAIPKVGSFLKPVLERAYFHLFLVILNSEQNFASNMVQT